MIQDLTNNFKSRKEQFSFILNLTESMLLAANKEDWERLSAMEPQRRQHVEQFFSSPANPDEASWIRQGIKRILDVDKQIIQISEKNKQAILDQSNNLSKGRDATRAYSQSR